MADDSLIDAFPLDAQSTESILARLLADTNAGVDPSDPLYADTVPGSVWDDLNRAMSLEGDRIYDRMLTEVPAAAMPLTATGAWLDAWASVVNLQRKLATAAEGTLRFTGDPGATIPNQTTVAAPAPVPGADPIIFQTTVQAQIPSSGVTYVDVPARAALADSAGNVPANSVTLLESEVSGATVTNPAAMTGGSDIETDDSLQQRVMDKLTAPPGAGNVAYYTSLALNYPGVYYVTVHANTPSKGFVQVIIGDVNNDPMPTSAVNGLQAQLDPGATPGAGFGDATIGATVTVLTPTVLDVTIAGAGVYAPGYSADGAGGTIALEAAITAAANAYVDKLPAGGTIVYNKVLAAIIDVVGMINVTGLLVNGAAADIALTSDEVASVTTVNIT